MLLHTGLEINIEEVNHTIQVDAASNPVIRLQIEYEVLFHCPAWRLAMLLLRHLICVRAIGENSSYMQ